MTTITLNQSNDQRLSSGTHSSEIDSTVELDCATLALGEKRKRTASNLRHNLKYLLRYDTLDILAGIKPDLLQNAIAVLKEQNCAPKIKETC